MRFVIRKKYIAQVVETVTVEAADEAAARIEALSGAEGKRDIVQLTNPFVAEIAEAPPEKKAKTPPGA